MSDEADALFRCYYCGDGIEATAPGRLDQCTNCGRYLHVCRMCTSYDPRETSKQCREDDAEEVRDKQAANFCDYFILRAGAYDAAEIQAHTQAQSELAGLFGDTVAEQPAEQSPDESRLIQDAEALFRK